MGFHLGCEKCWDYPCTCGPSTKEIAEYFFATGCIMYHDYAKGDFETEWKEFWNNRKRKTIEDLLNEKGTANE